MINATLLCYVDYTIIKVYLSGFAKSLAFHINKTVAWCGYNEGVIGITFKNWITIIFFNQNTFPLVYLVTVIVIACRSWRKIALSSIDMEGFIHLRRILEKCFD